MPRASHNIGDVFRIQFVWRLQEGDIIRAIYDASVLHLDPISDKYVVRLKEFLAGRQETEDGSMRPLEEVSTDYWILVAKLQGQRISVAYEVDDGRPLHLRLETLTGEHNFFRRLNEIPQEFLDAIKKRGK